MSITLRNKALRDTFAGMLADQRVQRSEVQALLDAAGKDGRISGREHADLQRLLVKAGDAFDGDARRAMASALGLPSPSTASAAMAGGAPVTGGTTVASERLSSLRAARAEADLDGQAAPVWGRSRLVPRLGTETLTREATAEGFELRHADGRALTPDEAKDVHYARPRGGVAVDDAAPSTTAWWGSCDQVALPGILFAEAAQDSVTVGGETFTQQDTFGLLATLAGSHALVAGSTWTTGVDEAELHRIKDIYDRFQG